VSHCSCLNYLGLCIPITQRTCQKEQSLKLRQPWVWSVGDFIFWFSGRNLNSELLDWQSSTPTTTPPCTSEYTLISLKISLGCCLGMSNSSRKSLSGDQWLPTVEEHSVDPLMACGPSYMLNGIILERLTFNATIQSILYGRLISAGFYALWEIAPLSIFGMRCKPGICKQVLTVPIGWRLMVWHGRAVLDLWGTSLCHSLNCWSNFTSDL